MTKAKQEAFKRRIKKKFGSLSNFARLAEIDRYELQKWFSLKHLPDDRAAFLEDKFKTTEPGNSGNVIPSDKLEEWKKAVDLAGGVYRVSRDKKLRMDILYKLYKGELKMFTPFVKNAFTLLGVIAEE